jgi:TolB-like protein/predicted Ser/Thr protein kinase
MDSPGRPAVGATISHYRILEKVGEGGMGTVWKAEDVHLQRTVALKFLHAADDVPRLLREAQAAASLSHPNICTVYEVDPERGFLAMEWVEGRTLHETIGGRPLPAEQALSLALQIGEGLRAAHHRGVVHRDVKSANVLVTPQGQAKILDFGLARVAGQAGLTREGAAAGTPGYMAPEQLRGEPVDRRTDIWAFGAVLHEMLTGRLPIGSMGTLPQGFDRVVTKALAADPAERYQHVDDLLVDLRRAGSRTPAPPDWRRRALIVGAVGVPVAAAIAWRLQFAGKGYSSLAVLPLENLSKDAEQEWFCDGMTETLIFELSKLRSLNVISRTSVMQYKTQRKPLRAIATELGVDVVVEGSTLRTGERALVKASLIDTATDRHLWANEYERAFADVISLHRELALAIAGEIKAALTEDERQELGPAKPVDPEAMEAYLRARHFTNRGPRYFAQAGEEARKAVALAPDFALGHALLGVILQSLGDFAQKPYAEVVPEARAELQRALELDPKLHWARSLLGNSYFLVDQDWERAEDLMRKAYEHIPGEMGSQYGMLLAARGRMDEGIAAGRRAVASDPLNPWSLTNLGRCYHFARRYGEAVALFRKALALDREFAYASFALTWSLFMQDKQAEAFESWNSRPLSAPADVLRAAWEKGGWDAAYDTLLRQSEAKGVPELTLSRQRFFRGIYTRDGDGIVGALEVIEKGGGSWLGQLQDPLLDPARDNPRFKALLKRLRYPEAMWK